MSVAKLQSMLNRLEHADKQVREKVGGMLSGGSLSGGAKKRCSCSGGALSGGVRSGGMLSGGGPPGFAGQGAAGMVGGAIEGFAGQRGGNIAGFAGQSGGAKCASRSGGAKGQVPPALRAWHAHLSAFRSAHPGLSMKEAMKQAKGSYKK